MNYQIKKIFKVKVQGNKIELDLLESTNAKLDYRKLDLILNNEQIIIKVITLPKAKPEALRGLIKNELSYYFKDIADIAFNYEILRENKSNYELAVFCIGCKKIKLVQKYISDLTIITNVYLIQFCFLNFLIKKIKKKDYILIFKYMDAVYLLYCKNHILLNTQIISPLNNEKNLKDMIIKFYEEMKLKNKNNIEAVYFANFIKEEYMNLYIDNIYLENMGEISKCDIIRNCK